MIGNLTDREKKIIEDNLRHFENNFGELIIEKEELCDNTTYGYYIYYPSKEHCVNFCYDISYLDGWLWGVVQGLNRPEFKNGKKEREVN